jgi:hypothetical protein
MRKLSVMMIGLAMTALAACDRGQNANSLAGDTSLSRDLSLANQVQPYQRLDSISALETTPMTAQEEAGPAEAPVAAPAPVRRSTASSATSTRRTASSSARRSTRTTPTSTRRRSTSRTRTSSAGDVDVGRAPRSEGRVVVERNTRRDAAIGAAAGAVIGAATSKNKVKGAVIGGVAGGVLGGIIGHTIDVKKRRVP